MKKETRSITMIIDRNKEGAWRISELINNHLVTKVYYFYTKRQALKLFKQYIKQLTEVKNND